MTLAARQIGSRRARRGRRACRVADRLPGDDGSYLGFRRRGRGCRLAHLHRPAFLHGGAVAAPPLPAAGMALCRLTSGGVFAVEQFVPLAARTARPAWNDRRYPPRARLEKGRTTGDRGRRSCGYRRAVRSCRLVLVVDIDGGDAARSWVKQVAGRDSRRCRLRGNSDAGRWQRMARRWLFGRGETSTSHTAPPVAWIALEHRITEADEVSSRAPDAAVQAVGGRRFGVAGRPAVRSRCRNGSDTEPPPTPSGSSLLRNNARIDIAWRGRDGAVGDRGLRRVALRAIRSIHGDYRGPRSAPSVHVCADGSPRNK